VYHYPRCHSNKDHVIKGHFLSTVVFSTEYNVRTAERALTLANKKQCSFADWLFVLSFIHLFMHLVNVLMTCGATDGTHQSYVEVHC